MLVVRYEQMKALADSRQQDWIMDYLAKSYPQKVRQLGHSVLSRLVEASWKQAHSRGFEEPEEIRKYVHVSFLLGEDFEANPKFRWAVQILESPRFKHPRSRLRALEDATLKSLKAGQNEQAE